MNDTLWNSCQLGQGPCSPAVAAWVLAAGALLALCIAIGLTAWQRRQDRRRGALAARQSALAQLSVIDALAAHVLERIEKLPPPGATAFDAIQALALFPTAQLRNAVRLLERIGPEHVPDGTVLVSVLGLIDCAKDATRLSTQAALAGDQGTRWSGLAHEIAAVRESAQTLRGAIRARHQAWR